MTINADDTVSDIPAFKEFLFLYKNLSDDGKPFLTILCIFEQRAVFPVNVIPLYEKFFQEPDHVMQRFSILVLEAFLFLFLQ